MDKRIVFAGTSLFLIEAVYFLRFTITGSAIGSPAYLLDWKSILTLLLSCLVIALGIVSNDQKSSWVEEVERLGKRYSRGRALESEYQDYISSLRSQLFSGHNRIIQKRRELGRLGPLTKIKYRLGEFIGKESPEKVGRAELNRYQQDFSQHQQAISHGEDLSQRHQKLLERRIDEEFSKLTRSDEAKNFLKYSTFKPSTSEEKIAYLDDLKKFNKFYSELQKKIRYFSHSEGQRIKEAVLEKYFPADLAGYRLTVPGIDEIDGVIKKINEEYRQPANEEVRSRKDYVIKPENLLLIHKTDYMPSQQKIRTTGNATTSHEDYSSEKFLPIEASRQTVHFSLNHPVVSHMMGNFDSKKYAILIPSEGVMKENIVTLNPSDTYSFGNVPLKNKDAEIVISREAYRAMSPKELSRLKKRTGVETVTLPNEGERLDEAIKRRIYEKGYLYLQANEHGDLYQQGDLKRGIVRLALAGGKDFDLHRSSPFRRLESDTVSRQAGSYKNIDFSDFVGEDVLEGSKQGLIDAREGVIKARGGEQYLTGEDIRSLDKLGRVVENYKYGPKERVREPLDKKSRYARRR